MTDRLVCADGGNPDPTRTHGKDAEAAKEIELAGWDYPRHLEGRLFSCVVHGDAEGADGCPPQPFGLVIRARALRPAGHAAELDRYIGYWQPYATSHEALDADHAIQAEVHNAARALLAGVRNQRQGLQPEADAGLRPPRDK